MKNNRVQVISDIAEIINSNPGCCFLRKAELIFESSIENDIDLLLTHDANNTLWKYLKKLGFKKKIDSKILNIYLYGAQPHIHYYNKNLDLHFDCVFGLFHKSVHIISQPGFEITHWIPLDKSIQEDSIKEFSKIKINECEINFLRSEVELVHLLAHVILDKKGNTDTYYKERIPLLLKKSDINKLKNMLNLVFFNFTDYLIELLEKNKFDLLFQEYIAFGDY